MTINLVEKIVSLYRTSKVERQLSTSGPQGSPSASSPAGLSASSSSGHQRTIFRALSPKGAQNTSRRQVFSADDAHILRLSACLWYLQQSLILANLLNEFEITAQELSALWSMFDRYDPTLSSEISWSDMPLLFEVSAPAPAMRVTRADHALLGFEARLLREGDGKSVEGYGQRSDRIGGIC